MKNLLYTILILFLCSCGGNPNDGTLTEKNTRSPHYKGIVTDEGYDTDCIRVKVDGKNYFRCGNKYQTILLTPVKD